MDQINFTEGYTTYITPPSDDDQYNLTVGGMLAIREKSIFELVIEGMNTFCMPVIILVGLIGNTASFSVFIGTHLKYQSSSIYLAFLNMIDNLFLISLGLGVWFGWVRVYIFHRQVLCQLIVYVTYVSSFLSVWTVVAFTVERYIVVFHPFRRHEYCTRGRANIVVSLLTVGALVGYSFALWTTGIHVVRGMNVCMTHPKYMQLLHTLTTVDTIVTLAIPSVLIIAFNCAICVKITNFLVHRRRYLVSQYAMERAAHGSDQTRNKKSNAFLYNGNGCVQAPNLAADVDGEAKNDGAGHSSSSAAAAATTSSSSQRSRNTETSNYKQVRVKNIFHWHRNSIQLRTTRSLLVVSSTFVLLNLPSHVVRLYALAAEFNGLRPPLRMLLWQQIFQIFAYSNFAINFFLYCACSRHFRLSFIRLVKNCCSSLSCRSFYLARNPRPASKQCQASLSHGKRLGAITRPLQTHAVLMDKKMTGHHL
ncbi:hypothetical protein LSH36_117g00008 [Paralvinella palmiformis]|uniref:G-protein coupled receptors family 1 profile domain-containing protein n=1 Tax=Paralvinella palmiformis TaxID=53620 RepID=A0AAD9JXW7_9ANNE|nr:hypothetical protein LSH36_117g00008 [Paralvinella palmiformis]